VSGRIIRRFLWSGFALLAASLLGMDLYVARHNADLWRPLLGGSFAVLALAGILSFVFIRSFSRRVSQIRAYAERLLDPPVFEQPLPTGDDDLGLLARSLQRTAPRIRELVESLKLEGARREAILAGMLEGVLAVDKDLRVTFCNYSFARNVNARFPVIPGIPLLELVRDPGLREIMTRVIATGERVEQRLTLPGAGSRSFQVLAGPLGAPAARGALAILHDVTELEHLERVRKDFVANVSHELRTPLAAIRGYAETLLDGALEDPRNNRKFVEIILAQATRLTNIASDLLSLSELESGQRGVPAQPVSVRSALESALRTVESAARVQGVRLICEKLEDARVVGHELRLEQVFVNLLDNAVKFNRPNGEVQVEMRRNNGKIRILIGDTGIGIPSEDLPRIFERFYRADKARSRAMGGTGLGLSIVKHAVEQMGGTVQVYSRLGEGSEFTIELPAA
jgi:two-component system, OmpR family, phosphate regulon sensor histidine kinase PhoR